MLSVNIIFILFLLHAWILEPYSGSGTTGVASSLLGRKYLGIEKEETFLLMSKS